MENDENWMNNAFIKWWMKINLFFTLLMGGHWQDDDWEIHYNFLKYNGYNGKHH